MGSGITEINKDTFWQLIEETKNQCGQDMDASISWIKKELLSFQSIRRLKKLKSARTMILRDGGHVQTSKEPTELHTGS